MSPSEERDQRLEKAKENTLVASNAQAIAENLQNLKAFPDTHRRRWIWELLQNAADASDAATAKNRVVKNGDLTTTFECELNTAAIAYQ